MRTFTANHHDRVIIGGRMTGKTTALVEWAKERKDHRVIIARDAKTAGDLVKRHGINALSVHAARLGLPGRVEVAVDDAQHILGELLGARVTAVALDVSADQGLEPSAEITLLRERDAFRLEEIAKLHRTIDALMEMAGMRCHCSHETGPERECAWHGDEYSAFNRTDPQPHLLADIARGLSPAPVPSKEEPF
jgi:hypothetical protein